MDKQILKALVIEDDPFSAAILRHYGDKMEKYSLDLHHANTLEESLSYLDSCKDIQIIFLDYRVHSRITGLEILQHIRANAVKAPVIIVTGSGNEEIAVALMKAGASDYLVKGTLRPEMLEKSISDALSRQENFVGIYARSMGEVMLRDMAMRASLSGVCMMSRSGIINYVNPYFVKIWGGRQEQDFIGKHLDGLLCASRKFNEILATVAEKKSWFGELDAKRADGSVFTVQALFSMIKYNEGDESQIMSSFLDITVIKEEEHKREMLYKGIMEVFALRAEDVGNVETADHIRRIAAYTRFIAEKLRDDGLFPGIITDKYISDLSYASMLHDVGKWRTPNEILLKPDALSESEWIIVKKHPTLGVEMLSPLLKEKGADQYLKLVEDVVLSHHEHWDGTGYPAALKGEQIPLAARIVALADVYDALTSSRSYRKALSHEEACAILETGKAQFDPRIFKVFLNHCNEFSRIRASID